MPQMIRLVERFWNTTQHYRRAYIDLVWTDVRWIIFSEHRLMMEAIRRRDAEEAGRLLYGHVRRTRLELERRNVFRIEAAAPTRRRRRKAGAPPA
jgi:DNA-binding GntR family transcriptional regulator